MCRIASAGRSLTPTVGWCQDPRSSGPVAVTDGGLIAGGRRVGAPSKYRTGSGSISPTMRSVRISHEAIYQAAYVQGRGALKRELVACLRTGRALRVPRARTRQRGRSFVTPEILISQRPAEADDRAVPGHWEGDLERHEAFSNRAVVKGHRFVSVAADTLKLRAAQAPGTGVRVGSSPEGDGTDQYCQMVRVRLARQKGVREDASV